MDSNENTVDSWYKKIKKLQISEDLYKPKDIETYRFVYRMTLEDRDKLALDKVELKAFVPIEKRLSDQLRIASPAYPIFIADTFTPYNYGGLLNRIEINT